LKNVHPNLLRLCLAGANFSEQPLTGSHSDEPTAGVALKKGLHMPNFFEENSSLPQKKLEDFILRFHPRKLLRRWGGAFLPSPGGRRKIDHIDRNSSEFKLN